MTQPIPIKAKCSGWCAVHCNNPSAFSPPERERLTFILEEHAQAHEAAREMRAVSEAEKQIFQRDAELLRRLAGEMSK